MLRFFPTDSRGFLKESRNIVMVDCMNERKEETDDSVADGG